MPEPMTKQQLLDTVVDTVVDLAALDARDRAHAVALAHRAGLLDLDCPHRIETCPNRPDHCRRGHPDDGNPDGNSTVDTRGDRHCLRHCLVCRRKRRHARATVTPRLRAHCRNGHPRKDWDAVDCHGRRWRRKGKAESDARRRRRDAARQVTIPLGSRVA